jgi:hypothetical protein
MYFLCMAYIHVYIHLLWHRRLLANAMNSFSWRQFHAHFTQNLEERQWGQLDAGLSSPHTDIPTRVRTITHS